MKKFSEFLFVFMFGAVLYSLIEIAYRGFTHWTMTLTGGFVFVAIYVMNFKMKTESILLRCAAGCAMVTATEFTVGMIVNRVFHLAVWDYSAQKFNLLGQICPRFTVIWFILNIPAVFICRFIRTRMLRRESDLSAHISGIPTRSSLFHSE